MDKIQGTQSRQTQYLNELLSNKKVNARQEDKNKKAGSAKETDNRDQVQISQEGRQLSEAREYYREFLKKRAEEVKEAREKRIEETKKRLKEHKYTINSERIAQELSNQELGY